MIRFDNFFLEIPVYDRALSASDHHQHGNEVVIEDGKKHKKSTEAEEETEVNISNLFFLENEILYHKIVNRNE